MLAPVFFVSVFTLDDKSGKWAARLMTATGFGLLIAVARPQPHSITVSGIVYIYCFEI